MNRAFVFSTVVIVVTVVAALILLSLPFIAIAGWM